jgi:hypothetical protein
VVLAIQVPISDCVDGEETDLYDSFDAKITENGHYHFVPSGRPVDEIDITVDIPAKFEFPFIDTITENGEYGFSPEPGSVFSEVRLNISVPTERKPEQFWTESYEISGTEQTFNFRPDDGYVFSGLDLTFEVPTRQLQTTISDNGSYHWEREYGGLFIDGYDITVAVPPQKLEESLVETITSNGSYSFSPTPGSVFSDASIAVDVHPSQSLVESITSNGSYHYTGEWKDADITIAVPSDQKPEQVGSFEVTDWNTTYRFDPDPGYVFSAVEIINATPTRTYTSTVVSNGSLRWEAGEGESLVSMLDINVNVHPSLSLSETYYSNGTYTISDENVGGTITVLVPDGELPVPADDEIYYLTYTGEPIVLYSSSDFGANLVSNTYQNGYGILKFDGPISRTGSSSFYNRIGLKKVVLPYSVTEISDSSFANTGLQVVVMQNTVASIGDAAFSGCFAMTTPFRISTGCELLSDGSFMDCTALTTITIPGRCTRLETGVFKGCSHLFNIYCNAVVPPVMDLNTTTNTYDQFEGCRQDFIIRVPAGSLQAYQTATGWSDYASRIVSQ